MEKVLTVLSFFLLVSIATFPSNSASACCGSSVDESVVATASGCTCDNDDLQIEMKNLALINVNKMMMPVCGVSLSSDSDVDAPDGLEKLIANSADQSPNSTPASPEVPAEGNSFAPIIVTILLVGLAFWGYVFYYIVFVETKRYKEVVQNTNHT